MATPTAIVGYLALFTSVGLLFLFANLLVGRLLRPSDPQEEKLEVYECGEPTIGSSFVQFDLRYYVVALVFIVFDVEVAFLFPLATIFGKTTNLLDERAPVVVAAAAGNPELTSAAKDVMLEMGVASPSLRVATESLGASDAVGSASKAVRDGAKQVAFATFLAINLFFIVLLVGFAYEWKSGAFDWVRAVSRQSSERFRGEVPPLTVEQQPTLTA